jgi:hypothetical protein
MDPARSASGREGVLYRPRVMVRGLTQVHNYLELRAAVFWRTCETLPLLGFRDIILVMVTRYGLENGLDNETGTPLAKVRGGGVRTPWYVQHERYLDILHADHYLIHEWNAMMISNFPNLFTLEFSCFSYARGSMWKRLYRILCL